jgi:prepilin-type N-terminal cleavage/methylation domain-containing protein
MKSRQHGYSLIEVLIAIAITSVVLLTVLTLFYMGRRNVYSGKQMTYAVAVGTRVLEDLSTMTADDVLTNFKIDDSTDLTTPVTLNNVAGYGKLVFANSVGRDTDNIDAVNTDPSGYLAAWKKEIDPAKLGGATVGVVITPRSPMIAANPVTTAQFTRVRVYVAWDEAANRRRFAFFDTTKVRH